MMEQDGDDFGPLYVDILKSCAPLKEPQFFNDQNPLNFHTSSDLSANVYKDLQDYDKFLLSECGVEGGVKGEVKGGVDDFDDFDDVIFDVEMEQKDAEFDSMGSDVKGKNYKMVEEYEINEVGDMMDEENDGFSEFSDMMCEYNEYGDEDLRGVTNDGICASEEDSESDESLNIILEDNDINDHNAGNDKKYVEKKESDHCAGSDKNDVELGLLRNCDNPYDYLEPGEITDMKTKLGIDVETRVGNSYQSSHTMSKGVKSVFASQTIDAVSEGEENLVNPVCNADYNYGGTRFRYLPIYLKRAFDIENFYSGYKPWKRPGVNLSDFFNYDLDEENWQNYRQQMIQLLQTSPPSKAVGYISEQLQSKNAPGQQIRELIQVDISRGERVACLENHHQSVCNSDAIIEIVFVDSLEEIESFTKELKDGGLHDNKTRLTTIHKIINGDKILPFPLDGSYHQNSHEERTSNWVSINYVQEGRQGTNFKSMVRKKKDHTSYKDWSLHLDPSKEKSEADQGDSGELLKYDKVMSIYANEDVTQNNEGQTTVRNMLEDDHGENSFRQGDSNYEKSLKQPYESKSTANVYDNQEITSNGFDDCRMRIEEILSQTDHQEGIDDNKFIKGSAVDEDFNSEQATEPIDNHEQEIPNTCNMANKLRNEVISDDQNHEAKREVNLNEESQKMQVSPKAGETCGDEMKQLVSNIKGFISEVDELVHSHEHEHRICCLR